MVEQAVRLCNNCWVFPALHTMSWLCLALKSLRFVDYETLVYTVNVERDNLATHLLFLR